MLKMAYFHAYWALFCIKVALVTDIACGSGVFLEEAFAYLQNACVQYYLSSGKEAHLLEVGNGRYKLPLQEKKNILCSCIYGSKDSFFNNFSYI